MTSPPKPAKSSVIVSGRSAVTKKRSGWPAWPGASQNTCASVTSWSNPRFENRPSTTEYVPRSRKPTWRVVPVASSRSDL